MRCKEYLILLLLIFQFFISFCQSNDSANTSVLELVTIRAFEQNRKLKDVPAAINFISSTNFERFSPASIVMAVNSSPGIRMEERSPGSYRINIRGSALRSPFGVRNVKVYFNDLPITDPGGQTYLNQLGYYNFNSIEIIKGPGSSLYGAGTGGVLLIESMKNEAPSSLEAEWVSGSYGLKNIYGAWTSSSGNYSGRISFQHQQSNGFRDHSAMKRQLFNWDARLRIKEKNLLKTTILFGDHFYETPGALTLAEYNLDHRAARPSLPGIPGAIENKASITQRSFLAGASYLQFFGNHFSLRSSAYGMFTSLQNPSIRNYGRSAEPHAGWRSVLSFSPDRERKFKWDVGAEWQYGKPSVDIFKNNSGEPDTLQTHDDLINRQHFLFTQIIYSIDAWSLSAGASINLQKTRLQRFSPSPGNIISRNFNNEIAPRIAVSRHLGSFHIYSAVSRGFSPPTTSEISPTGSALNPDLDPESGVNFELGLKASLPKKIYLDINAFLFRLQNSIVQRRDAAGGDYFINGGRIRQKGIETYLSMPIFSGGLKNHSFIWLSHTWHHFRYLEFKQLDNDFSGKYLPGIAPHTIATGADIQMNHWLNSSLTYYFSDRIPLNDANAFYASAYHLLGLKMSADKIFPGNFKVRITGGIENILDQKYSLGNDVNGFGGRFYNAAPGRNYYISLRLEKRNE